MNSLPHPHFGYLAGGGGGGGGGRGQRSLVDNSIWHCTLSNYPHSLLIHEYPHLGCGLTTNKLLHSVPHVPSELESASALGKVATPPLCGVVLINPYDGFLS